jgi:hypothetical protein
MEVDDRPDEPAPGEFKVKEKEEEMEGTPIAGLIMGGLERSYLVHGDSTFDVLRNVEGGVEAAGVTPFSFTPAKGAGGGKKGGSSSTPAFTPTKVVLAGSERFMNMLAAEDPTKLYHGDVEYQKIVSEFRFDKDTVNIPQVGSAEARREKVCPGGKVDERQSPMCLAGGEHAGSAGILFLSSCTVCSCACALLVAMLGHRRVLVSMLHPLSSPLFTIQLTMPCPPLLPGHVPSLSPPPHPPQIDITNDSKPAQLTDSSMLLGLDANRICKWDMRTPGGVATYDSPLPYVGGKDYARGTNFTCMATSGDGWVVVGSRDGKLRLYNGTTLSQAKTSIPGLGKPITSVDVTYDGRYVLATTDDYLLLVKTTWMEGGELGGSCWGRCGSPVVPLPVPGTAGMVGPRWSTLLRSLRPAPL